jgi:hypothetical protein
MAPSQSMDATRRNHEELVARYARTLTSNHMGRPKRTTHGTHALILADDPWKGGLVSKR